MSTGAAAVEVVRGGLGDEQAEEILGFWSARGLEGDAARELLPSVVCMAVDDEGEVVGVDFVEEQVIPLVGRRFWDYRWLLADDSEEIAVAMFNATFEALAEEFETGGEGPIGLSVAIGGRETLERGPEAIWPGTELTFAGYLPDDRQLRIRYFWGATIEPGASGSPSIDQLAARKYEAEDQIRIEALAESDSVTKDDVLALWAREGVVADAAAQRRIDQVHLVAVAGENEIAGVSSIYLDRSEPLRMDMWNYRTFVPAGHRHSSVGAQLLFGNIEVLERRFRSGEDTRAQGILFDLENEEVMKGLNTAVWPLTGYTFIGENPLGAHIRVRYFEGAQIPTPEAH
jgi:hypothetical protein